MGISRKGVAPTRGCREQEDSVGSGHARHLLRNALAILEMLERLEKHQRIEGGGAKRQEGGIGDHPRDLEVARHFVPERLDAHDAMSARAKSELDRPVAGANV